MIRSGARGSGWTIGERAGSLAAATIFTGFLLPGLVPALAAAPAGRRAAALTVTAIYLPAGIGAVAAVGPSSGAARRWVPYGTLALGAVLVALLGAERSWLLVSALTVVAVLRPWWEASAVSAATVAAATAAGSGIDNAIVLVAAVVAVVFTVVLAEANAALRVAHQQIGELVTARERARMSRDLHDVLGHSLTTIAVKAGLARQLLDTGAGSRAAAEVADVERLARQALGDVRSTVAGSRETTLAGELAAARETLLAAGIAGDLPSAVESVRPDLRCAFAHVLREGITNVVRHSAASRVTVRLEPELISVRDDGSGTGPAVEGAGLRGLRERLAASRARLEHGPVAGGGYELTARGSGSAS